MIINMSTSILAFGRGMMRLENSLLSFIGPPRAHARGRGDEPVPQRAELQWDLNIVVIIVLLVVINIVIIVLVLGNSNNISSNHISKQYL